MVNGPIILLIKLNYTILKLNHVQSMIDRARTVSPMDQHFQLELDREQSKVDQKRVLIAQVMAAVRNNN